MKPSVQNKYSLQDIHQYNKELDASAKEIMTKYSELLIEYVKFVTENVKIKNNGYSSFVIARGLDTITNVFNHILYYTKNLNMTFIHCQKAFYFYVEFICQISETEKLFLQLTSRDATTYVYKKTIFDMPNDIIKKTGKCTEETNKTLILISHLICIQKMMVLKVIQSENNRDIHIDKFQTTTKQILDCNLDAKQYAILKQIVELLFNKVHTLDVFYNVIEIIVQQISAKPQLLFTCEKKINNIDFDEELNNMIQLCDESQIASFLLTD